jgi:hypothetical protein
LTQAQFFSVLGEIGMDPAEMRACLDCMTVADKESALAVFKDRARRAFKQRLFEVHPDRNADDPNAEERTKQLNAVSERFHFVLDSLKVVPRQPRREIIHHVAHRRTQWTPDTTSTTTSSVINGPGVTVVSIGWHQPPFGY